MSLFISIVVFILILAVLVLVHEFGHFIVAKKSGIKVEEFGFGFPPRAKKLFKRGDTVFTLNWIPFGGFVKIFGENPEDLEKHPEDKHKSFSSKSKWTQAAVLLAGPVFNLLFAWLALSLMFIVGAPAVYNEQDAQYIKNPRISIVEIVENSPASEAGLLVGDSIVSLTYGPETFIISDPTQISQIVENRGAQAVEIKVQRKNTIFSTEAIPSFGLFEGQSAPALGVAIDRVGTLRLPIHKAIASGFERTWQLTKSTASFLGDLLSDLVTKEKADLSAVTGPIGIVPVVGDALSIGFSFVVIIMSLISINLAIINLLPFPALDGGRLLFILIETIKGSPIHPKTAGWINATGFLILLALMLVVTVRDIIQLV